MKKILLSLAAILLVNFSLYSQDNAKCEKKCDKKTATKECTTSEAQSKKLFMGSSVNSSCNNKENTSGKRDVKAAANKTASSAVKSK